MRENTAGTALKWYFLQKIVLKSSGKTGIVKNRFGARSSMDRASDFESESWGFESLRARQ
jgi:hypothetical protein